MKHHYFLKISLYHFLSLIILHNDFDFDNDNHLGFHGLIKYCIVKNNSDNMN